MSKGKRLDDSVNPGDKTIAERHAKTQALKNKDTMEWLETFRKSKASGFTIGGINDNDIENKPKGTRLDPLVTQYSSAAAIQEHANHHDCKKVLPKSTEETSAKPAVRKRTYHDDLKDPNMIKYRNIMNNWIVYKKYVAELGLEGAFNKTVDEVGKETAIAIRYNYHALMGNS
ncbi:hypothetical protein ACLMJK_003740 [Lecanora helva]